MFSFGIRAFQQKLALLKLCLKAWNKLCYPYSKLSNKATAEQASAEMLLSKN